MKIAIYGREFQSTVAQYVRQLFELLEERKIEVWVYQDFKLFLNEQYGIACQCKSYLSIRDFPADIRFMLSLGGDGTMLAAVSILRDSQIPITGINLGRLGFLASINKENIAEALDSLLKEDFTIERRTLLAVKAESSLLFNGDSFALNDVTLIKRDTSAMITLNVSLNGELLNEYWADGLIIATPTGSTAYSLSCGGPIISPGSGNFVITPIAPHNLNVRPIVISDEDVLSIKIESRGDRFLLSCDSRTANIGTNERIIVSKADFFINLIRLKDESFFSTLRAKLLWGLDTRNY